MRADRQAVAITGMGVVSPAGHDLPGFWSRLVEGKTAIRPIANIPTDRLTAKLAAEVRDFDPEALGGRALASLDRFAQFAVVAARRAIADSGLDLGVEDRDRIPVILGTGTGGQTTMDANYEALYGRGAQRFPPLTVPRLMSNAAACHVSIDLGVRGEVYAIASACASATHAIGAAFRMVRAGDAAIAITGGTEACLTIGTIKAWEALRVMSNNACRPFSRTRDGMVLGEGAAVLVLENLEHARARGAFVHAVIRGFAATADAGDLTSPDVEQVRRTMALAIADAGLTTSDIDYINAHGTGTQVNDATEARAIHMVFGEHASKLLVSSSKSVLGHSLGATGALEAVATALALREGVVPPTAGWEEADPACDLDVVPNVARKTGLRTALSNSFAFGGLNAVLALERA